MDYKKYRILYSPRVIDSLDKIYQYIAEEIGSVEAARRKVVNIRKDINRLEIFPQAGFDADERERFFSFNTSMASFTNSLLAWKVTTLLEFAIAILYNSFIYFIYYLTIIKKVKGT